MEDKTNNLKHLKVDGFKSIAKLDLPMENINLLIGANGAGKSNFISALLIYPRGQSQKISSIPKTA